MGARGVLIHICRAGHSIFLADSNDPKKLQLLSHVNFSEVINVISLFVLAYFKVSLGRVKQISYLFHVNFEDRDLQFEL